MYHKSTSRLWWRWLVSFDPKINILGCLIWALWGVKFSSCSNTIFDCRFRICMKNWQLKVFSFYENSFRTIAKLKHKVLLKRKVHSFTKKIKGRGSYVPFIPIFDCLPDWIFKKGTTFNSQFFMETQFLQSEIVLKHLEILNPHRPTMRLKVRRDNLKCWCQCQNWYGWLHH